MIKPRFKILDVARELENKRKALEKAFLVEFQYAAEESIRQARTNRGFIDRSGALISSIGFAIFIDGKLASENFQGDNDEGIAKGKKLVRELSSRARGNKIFLVFVAGMEYATHVEAQGRAVLSPAESWAKTHLPAMLDKVRRSF